MTALRRCLLVAGFAWFIASPVAAQEAARPAESADRKEAAWSKYGLLGKTELLCEDGQPVYALRDGEKLITYVATIKGKSLENYFGLHISVYGPTLDLTKEKTRYVLVSHVAVGNKLIEMKARKFALPIEIDEKQKEEITSVRIFVSENRGKTWKKARECEATEKELEFVADRDDMYWFAFQVVKKDGTKRPAEEKDLTLALVVNVDPRDKASKLEESGPASPGAAKESWVGKTVLTKRDGVKLSLFDETGETVKQAEVVGFGQHVLDEKYGWLSIRNGLGATGWIPKADAVRVEDAAAYFTEGLQQDPKNVFALTSRGTVLMMSGKQDDALKDLDAAFWLDPKNVGAYRSRARIWHQKSDLDRAIADLNQAIQLDPTYSYAYSWRGSVRLDKGEFDKAIADCTEALRLDPKNIPALQTRSGAWAIKGNFGKATADAAEINRLDPKNADVRLNRLLIFSNKGEFDKAFFDKALAECDEAIRLDPKDWQNYQTRGVLWLLKKEYQKAIADDSEAIRLNPQDPAVYCNRGEVWNDLKEYDKAIADYSQALKLAEALNLGRELSSFYSERGLAYFLKKDQERALQDFDRAEKGANNLELEIVYSRRALMYASSADPKYRDGKKAVEFAMKAVKLSTAGGIPENVVYLHPVLAAAYAEVGDFAEAVRWQEKAMKFPEFRDDPDMRRRLELYRNQRPYRQE